MHYNSRMVSKHKYWHNRGYIPHFDAPRLIQHVSFHLADSLPKQKVKQVLTNVEALPLNEQSLAKIQRWQELLDAGHGCCSLRQARCANIVQDCLLFGDDERYRLLAWVVMPNHVHALIEQKEGWPLSKVVQGWKGYSSREIHRLDAGAMRPLWQRDYWDRFIRDEGHFRAVKRYIENNPVRAGLVGSAEQWRWSSSG